jgi:hypothetical protein
MSANTGATNTGASHPDGNAARAALWMTGAIVSFSLMAVAGRSIPSS